MGLTSSAVTRAPDKYIFVSDDPIRKRCKSIILYYTCMDSGDFSRKTDSTRRNPQMYTWMKARDVKKKNQMKSKLFRGNLSTRKGEVPFYIPL